MSNMTVVETVKSAVGLSDAPAREFPPVQWVAVALFPESHEVSSDWEAMFANDYCVNSCDKGPDVRGQAAYGIQRLLRQPPHPPKPLPLRGILLAMEV